MGSLKKVTGEGFIRAQGAGDVGYRHPSLKL